jgi:signal transduction histidine kinase
VENAVKNTLEGSVRLEIQYAPEEIGTSQRRNRGGHLQVAVSDTGIGIPSEYLPAIFDRFFRVPSKRSRSIVSGSGLGLAICRELVEQMGGAISVRSVENEGTTFEFSIYVKEGNGAL